jgi:glycosyltransferase involved in cell wall biosynthesis
VKILAISNIFPPGFMGGYELGAFEVLGFLARKGHQIHVITSDFLDEAADFEAPMVVERSLEWLSFKHDRWPEAAVLERGSYFNPSNIRRIAAAIRNFQPDIVMCFSLLGMGALSIPQFIDRCGIPFLMYFMDYVFAPIHADDPLLHRYESVFGPLGYVSSPICVSMSRTLQDELSRVPGLLSEDVRIVPGWVHAVQPPRTPPAQQQKTEFVFCSRIAEHKGIAILQSAVEVAINSGCTDFIVDVYGQGDVQQFIHSVQSRGLDRWIRYSGSLDKAEMCRKMYEHDALLLPTWEREPFAFVVSEAAAAGCLPVMTAGIGASEWFVDEVDSLKIPRNADALAAAIRRVVEMSPADRCVMQSAAQDVARNSLLFDYWAEEIHGMCLELNARPRVERPSPRAIEAAFQVLGDLWFHKPA